MLLYSFLREAFESALNQRILFHYAFCLNNFSPKACHFLVSLSTRSVSFLSLPLPLLSVENLSQHLRNLKFIVLKVFFLFFTLTANDWAYAHPAVCGRIHCRTATRWMRAQILQNPRHPAGEYRRVLAACRLLVVCQLSFIFMVRCQRF